MRRAEAHGRAEARRRATVRAEASEAPRADRPEDALEASREAFLTHVLVERGLATRTADAYARDLADFAAFARRRGAAAPPDIHRATIRAYGVLDEARNVAWRSTFVIDRDGLIRWGKAGDRHMVRDGAEILRILDLVARLRA